MSFPNDYDIHRILDLSYPEYSNINENYRNKILTFSNGDLGYAKSLTIIVIDLIKRQKKKSLDQLLSKLNHKDNLFEIYKKLNKNQIEDFSYIVLKKIKIK